MEMFSKNFGEVKLWHVLLGAFVLVILAMVVKDAITTEQLVVTPGGNTFVKRSFWGPLSSEQYASYAKAKDEAVAKSDNPKK